MEIKEKNFFKKVWTSIRDFEGYEEFAAGKVTKAIQYIITLTLIFAAVIVLSYTYKFSTAIQETRNYIDQNIEQIKYENGKMQITANSPIIIEDQKGIIPVIIIDTNENINKSEQIQKLKSYNTGLLLTSDEAVLVSNILGREESISYSSILKENINSKQDVLELLSTKNMMYTYVFFAATIFVYLFIVCFASHIVDIIVLAVLGYLFARIIKLRLRFKATFNIGVYALTLPMILNLIYIVVNTFTGFEIKYFGWMYQAISYIYVIVAILMIKTEIINQKIQLIRLAEIQEQTAKEEQIQEPQEKPKEKEEKEKEDEKKENNRRTTRGVKRIKERKENK